MNSQELYELSEQFSITKKKVNIVNLASGLVRLVIFHSLEVSNTKVLVSFGATVIRPNFARLFTNVANLLDGKFLDLSFKRSRFCWPTARFEDLCYLQKLNISKTTIFFTFCYMTYLRNCLRMNDKKIAALENIDVYVGFLPKYGLEGIIAKKVKERDKVFTLQHGFHPESDFITNIDRLMIKSISDTKFLVHTKQMKQLYKQYSPISISELLNKTSGYDHKKLLILGPGPGYEHYVNQFLQKFNFDEIELFFRYHPASKKKASESFPVHGLKHFHHHPVKFRGHIVCIETGMYYDLCKLGRTSYVYIDNNTRNYALFSSKDVFSQELLQASHPNPYIEYESRVYFAQQLMGDL